MKEAKQIFVRGFIYVFLQAVVTWLIANKYPIGIFIAAYVLNYLWVGNVKKASVGNQQQRHIYSAGAAIGGITGYFLMEAIKTVF